MEMDTGQAWREIYAAIAYKQNECGAMPEYPLLIPERPEENAINVCALAIVQKECPFTEYPTHCLALWGADWPGISQP